MEKAFWTVILLILCKVGTLKGDVLSEYGRKKSYSTDHELFVKEMQIKTNFDDLCAVPSDDLRFNCLQGDNASKETCLERGCCWNPIGNYGSGASAGPPSCYYPTNYVGYTVSEVKNSSMGISAELILSTKSYYPDESVFLFADVLYETDSRVRLRIGDSNRSRYEVPLNVPNVKTPALNRKYDVRISGFGQRFSLTVSAKSPSSNNTRVLINSTGAAPLIFSDQFIQFSTFLPSQYLYGLGQYRGPLLHNINWTRRTIWNRDQFVPVGNVGANLYGSHPFYLVMEEDGNAHGVFLLNSNAMDIDLQPTPALAWRTIGGIIDMYVFIGPTPADVIRQYTDVIGHPFMPPYWSLGYHQSRWGYKTANRTLEVVDRVRAAGIPQDVQWNDLEYSDGQKDFTTGYNVFGDQPALVAEIHKRQMRYIMITDCGISSNQPAGKYPPYDIGFEMDIFIKNYTGDLLVGKCWPGETVWPDFTNPKTTDYWSQMIQNYHSKVPFDGIWIDMNEMSNFVDGSVHGCTDNKYDHPLYMPHVTNGSLYRKSICPSARQYLGLNYNVHSLYGYTETKATYTALQKTLTGKRPFIISRSTFAGSGHYGGNWNGDNHATYVDMHSSIIDILNANMFGIPMMGACVCGFLEDTTEQLCQRWTQLGSFYPFYWNHNERWYIPQDPAAFSEEMAKSSRKVHLIRYSFLPYFYTLFYDSHVNGDIVVRPLFFEYPNDKNTFSIDKQFMWGPCLLVTPVLEEDQQQVSGYVPKDVWYDFYTGQKINGNGTYQTLDAPLDKINLHIRAGCIIPMQNPALNTVKSRKNRFRLLVALNSALEASGNLMWDDGESIDSIEKGVINRLDFVVQKRTLVVSMTESGYKTERMTLGSVDIFGMDGKPSTVLMNGHRVKFSYDSTNKVLQITGIAENLFRDLVVNWK
ncbi:hypothetical protein FSP39_012163 [Pinctada imbricata]|uniref:P-type domain-containing protein n=1 Tax=Pinctada imbricata TaxID=66713 RepID=A0AA89C1I5_PINIB|nr:hypothetical protein FSP39_012163 [Pinctada imbricata]